MYVPRTGTFHLMHVLTQAALGLITAHNGQSKHPDRRWIEHILGDNFRRRITVRNFFARIESQDGAIRMSYTNS
eukprot:435610-Prorocentrum_lima.AAC.1